MEMAVVNFVRGNLLRLSVDNKLNAFREFTHTDGKMGVTNDNRE